MSEETSLRLMGILLTGACVTVGFIQGLSLGQSAIKTINVDGADYIFSVMNQ